ncbi:MAG: acylphosphatase [Candidatus Binatia bacterium]
MTFRVPEIRARLRVRGFVQGVFYRASARRQAAALGLRGFVKNRDDGSVEVVAEGPEAAIERFIEWCREGPPGARVTKVDVERGPATGEFRGFSVS